MLENKFKQGLTKELKERFPGCVVVHLDPNEVQGHGSGDGRGQSKCLCERHYARRHAEAEPGYGDGRNRKRCACAERGIGTGLISSDILPLWRREAAPGNFRAAFIFFTPSGADAPAPSKREPFKGAHLRAQGE